MIDWSSIIVISESLAQAMAILGIAGLAVRLAEEVVHRVMNHGSGQTANKQS